jgi:hypothetical protein
MGVNLLLGGVVEVRQVESLALGQHVLFLRSSTRFPLSEVGERVRGEVR